MSVVIIEFILYLAETHILADDSYTECEFHTIINFI